MGLTGVHNIGLAERYNHTGSFVGLTGVHNIGLAEI